MQKRWFLPLLGGAFLSLVLVPADGQEWTRFRGPNGSGVGQAAGLPVTWTAEDYLWRVPLPGTGHSSPVVWGKRVFITSALDDATQVIRCLNADDGTTIWERRFPATPAPMNRLNHHCTSTPTIDANHLYVTWTTSDAYIVVALNQADGADVWRRDLAPFKAEHGFGASPILCQGRLIVPNDQDDASSLIAMDRNTGETAWKVDRPGGKADYATPIVYRPKQGRSQLIFSSGAAGLTSLNPADGSRNWELPLFEFRVIGSPVIAGDLIVAGCGSGGGGKRLVAVRPGVPELGTKPEVAYDFKGSLPYVVTPIALGNRLFLWADSGVVSCVDVADGRVVWRKRVGGKYYGSPVAVGNRLYCMSTEGQMTVVEAADRYKLLGKIDLGEPSQSTPAVAAGRMFLRTRSHLMVLGPKK
ncbi:MAG: PQQ-binding-like beta-propeller repeat protein [Pirellulales bacterium]|nr:PQQ-binding-like beta-propeller repeat protein [Pirellulales bacterium]